MLKPGTPNDVDVPVNCEALTDSISGRGVKVGVCNKVGREVRDPKFPASIAGVDSEMANSMLLGGAVSASVVRVCESPIDVVVQC